NGQFVPALTNGTTVVVTNQSGATVVSGVVNFLVPTVAGNSIDDALFFVQQQYLDFFDREADDKGLDFWKNQITQCGSNDDCLKGQRINTSGAFFMSIEFQNTGYMLYRLNKVSFGQRPLRREFLIDMQKLGRGVVVGATGWEVFLEANKRQFVTDWANSANFRALYDALTNEQFVDKLAQNAGVTLTANERAALADGLRTGADTRAGVLRKLAENESLKRREFNAAFVLMQYFGYLHRDPDDAGFNYWLKKLEEFGGDFHTAQMVEAFITAGEYRGRFNW
ncbi:MAG TPA: DUF4214 domain-containing protein, partial [Pyrinomonadaceae bacterium]|nr:DUF4214 domain-containing protein [Pyrinomonadaceae bacterium]